MPEPGAGAGRVLGPDHPADDAQLAEFEACDLGDDMAAAGTAQIIRPRRPDA